jgi:hypothetical protein
MWFTLKRIGLGSAILVVIFVSGLDARLAHADLVVDSGFESATAGPTSGSLGDGVWTASQGQINVLADPTEANSGAQSVQLTYGLTLNAVTQALATVPGRSYSLSFFVASDDGTDPFQVTFGGQVVTSSPVPQTFPPLGIANGTYIQEAFTVTAPSRTTDLTFQSQYGGSGASFGTFLDDVSVVARAVPEPASIVLLGLGSLSLLSLARRRPAGRFTS